MIIIIKLHFLLCILFVAVVVLVWVIFVVCSFCFKKVWIAPAGKKRQTQSNHDIYCPFPFYSWVWKKKIKCTAISRAIDRKKSITLAFVIVNYQEK